MSSVSSTTPSPSSSLHQHHHNSHHDQSRPPCLLLLLLLLALFNSFNSFLAEDPCPDLEQNQDDKRMREVTIDLRTREMLWQKTLVPSSIIVSGLIYRHHQEKRIRITISIIRRLKVLAKVATTSLGKSNNYRDDQDDLLAQDDDDDFSYFALFYLSLMMIMVVTSQMLKLLDHDLGFLVLLLQLRHCRQPFKTFIFQNLSSTTNISTFFSLHCRTL